MKPKLTPEQKEAQEILKDIEKKKEESPKDETDLLKWTMPQLRAYVLKQTSGMNPTKKMKWAGEFNKRIKEAKKNSPKNKMYQ